MSDIYSLSYVYRVFGLTLVSEIDFPELFLSAGPVVSDPDISVRWGKVPPKESVAGTQKPYSAYNGAEFWSCTPGIAMYYVKNGSEIIIESLGGSLDEIRLFFLGGVLGAMLYQRDHIPLHASGVVGKTGGVYLFTAPSRTGKSTLLYTLSQMGYRPFTDDVCILTPAGDSGKELNAYAAYPMMKLWKETLKTLQITETPGLKRLRPELEKFGLHFREQFSDQPEEVKGIIVLEADNESREIRIERLSPIEAFKALEKNVYRRYWIHGMGKVKAHFMEISQWSNLLPVYLAKRPVDDNSIREFGAAISREVLDAGV